MAEVVDTPLLDLDRSTQGPGVMEIIGGLGLIQSLEDAVDAVAVALESPWMDMDVLAENDRTSPEILPESETSDVDHPEEASTEDLAECQTDGTQNPLISPSGRESEVGSPAENGGPLNEVQPKPAAEPQAEMLAQEQTSAQEATEPESETPAGEPSDAEPPQPPQCLTEPQTRPDQETSMQNDSEKANSLADHFNSVFTIEKDDAIPFSPSNFPAMERIIITVEEALKLLKNLDVTSGDKEDLVTSQEQVEEVMSSQPMGHPMPDGEEIQPNGDIMGTGHAEEERSDCQAGEEECEKDEEVETPGKTLEDSSCSPGSSHQASKEKPARRRKEKSLGPSSYSKYNTVSYRTIRRGNTRQRIDEFESMIHI
ncbi:hypothetical protein GJAV_G00211780 [Gymnothorax javanicus]|nr:hypothetical protein GJAV_G00211780 [Gymnothorax javanicus]